MIQYTRGFALEQGVVIEFDKGSCNGVVREKGVVDELDSKWFGRRSGDELVLSLVETAYLLLGGRATVRVDGESVSDLHGLVSLRHECFAEFFWPMLTVYKDLRDRGRRVRPLGGNSFLVKDKHGDVRIVYVLEEKALESTDSLVKYVEAARSNSLQAVFAIVSLQGDLTYYEVSRISPVVG